MDFFIADPLFFEEKGAGMQDAEVIRGDKDHLEKGAGMQDAEAERGD